MSFGVIGGIGCGLNYMVPVVVAWEYFPNNKGLVSGILSGSYGIGSFFYTLISTHIVNP